MMELEAADRALISQLVLQFLLVAQEVTIVVIVIFLVSRLVVLAVLQGVLANLLLIHVEIIVLEHVDQDAIPDAQIIAKILVLETVMDVQDVVEVVPMLVLNVREIAMGVAQEDVAMDALQDVSDVHLAVNMIVLMDVL